ncbi:WxcM-like protein [Photobacterium gaetbulicola]|uniref:WxcM-like protein n=1 Tax=Photobacterium gaetbulicola TaxID=1295392 RepID=A0A0B9H9T0_9GAMM|nr:WxcM-like protein [Photobacterium gaetbulicola]KHT65607.1 WxcM-like protein [Photobacterium gaetbulicola]
MKANKPLLEVSEYNAEGYSPMIDYQSWRVAMLNYIDELETDKIDNFQCHEETDEVFVLLEGKCILFCAEVDEENNIVDIVSWDMEPNKAYNIKRGVYHTHTLSNDGKVLIIENSDINDSNSPKILIDDTVRYKLGQLVSVLWS